MRTGMGVLNQITRSFHFRDKRIFKKLYIQYVRPHLEFSSAVWNPWSKQDVDNLEKVQKRAVGMISGLKGVTYEEKLTELGLDSLESRRKRTDMIQTFKILAGIDKVEKSTWFTTQENTNSRTTRAASCARNLIRTTVSRTDVRNNFYSQRVINSWNSLPDDVKMSKNVAQFKNNYDKYACAGSGARERV